ncbi:MAG: hypothetical protein K6T85_03115 [Gorillibacterium sp.]|nr:hypothetical protein [Gorillibacterium sp.]
MTPQEAQAYQKLQTELATAEDRNDRLVNEIRILQDALNDKQGYSTL